jgi:hypothetical protein
MMGSTFTFRIPIQEFKYNDDQLRLLMQKDEEIKDMHSRPLIEFDQSE